MGGIGKTTIAKAVFHKLKRQFESFSFIENVREQLTKMGSDQLVKECLKELLKDEDIDIYNMRSDFVKNRLQCKKILLVLDDVDNSISVEGLTRVCDWFGQESKIIITSRDKQVLRNVAASTTYHVRPMNDHDVFYLFSLKAFKQNEPPKSYIKLSKWVVDYCQGNPLALVVLGCYLYGRKEEEWKSAQEKLKQAPHGDIFNVLTLSFYGLDDDIQRDIFLDLACLFKIKNKFSMSLIRDYYDSSIDLEISVLEDKSLISIIEKKIDKYIEMHDLIVEMGIELATQQTFEHRRPIRLLNNDDIYHFIKNNKVTETIQFIALDMCKTKKIRSEFKVLEDMHNLKFLFCKSAEEPSNVDIIEGPTLPEKLRIMHWVDYPLSYVSLTSCAENLVELLMPNSNLQYLWDENLHFPKLKMIFLNGSKRLVGLPDLSLAPNIEFINMEGCVNLGQVYSSSILPKLRTLILIGCEKLWRVNIGSNINGRSLRLAIVLNCIDLVNLSFNRATIEVFMYDDDRISGFRFKVVSVPFTEISECMNSIEKNAKIELLGQNLKGLLPFVTKVRWLDINEFGNSADSFRMRFFRDEIFSGNLYDDCRLYLFDPRRRPVIEQSIDEKDKTMRWVSENGRIIRQWKASIEEDKEEELIREVKCNRLPRVLNCINRWSLITQLTLPESDIIGGACSNVIDRISTLKSLAQTNFSNLKPIIDLTFSLDDRQQMSVPFLAVYLIPLLSEGLSYSGFTLIFPHAGVDINFRLWDS